MRLPRDVSGDDLAKALGSLGYRLTRQTGSHLRLTTTERGEEESSMLPAHRPPTHPGEMLLKEFLEPLGVSQVDAAQRMRVPFQRLNAIVKGRHAVSADTALLLEALTGWDAEIWLSLQAKWDLWHAQRARGHRLKVKPLQALPADAR